MDLGRFTQQDGWEFANPKDPLSLNLYTYCWNNPIMYFDYMGKWSDFVKKIGNHLKHGFTTVWLLASAPIKSLNIELGFGVGFGYKGKFSMPGTMDIEFEARIAATEKFVYDDNSIDVRNETGNELSIVFLGEEILNGGYKYEHSLCSEFCTCDMLYTPFVEQAKCPESHMTNSLQVETPNPWEIEISNAIYWGIGVEYTVGFDFSQCAQYWYEAIQYAKSYTMNNNG